jgi:NTE family protein
MKPHAPAEKRADDDAGIGVEVDSARHPAHIHLPPYETIALVLQGGGALGAYQAGVYEGLDEAGIAPNWISGISIGALNTAIIAGNAPAKRVERLREFWETICRPAFWPSVAAPLEQMLFDMNEMVRKGFTALQAAGALMQGQHGFFTPRMPTPLPWVSGDPAAASWYDTSHLKTTLERLCDFDRINAREVRVSVGAVNVGTGNFAYFDNTRMKLRPEHFIASGALPPGFAAVEIDGEHYWDGGVVSNTPLYEVMRSTPRKDTLAFQVDLWSARGPVPDNIAEVASRVKDIQYSSRTRLVTDMMQRSQRFRNVLREVLEKVPADVRENDPWCQVAEELACGRRYNVLHLIYQQQKYEAHYKDYQFGVSTMREHWAAGLKDIRDTLAHRDWLDMPDNDAGFVTHDIHRARRNAETVKASSGQLQPESVAQEPRGAAALEAVEPSSAKRKRGARSGVSQG